VLVSRDKKTLFSLVVCTQKFFPSTALHSNTTKMLLK
jgi:hypothetical protein